MDSFRGIVLGTLIGSLLWLLLITAALAGTATTTADQDAILKAAGQTPQQAMDAAVLRADAATKAKAMQIKREEQRLACLKGDKTACAAMHPTRVPPTK